MVTLALRTGGSDDGLLGFHDRHFLVHECWGPSCGEPSGSFGSVAMKDTSHIIVW